MSKYLSLETLFHFLQTQKSELLISHYLQTLNTESTRFKEIILVPQLQIDRSRLGLHP